MKDMYLALYRVRSEIASLPSKQHSMFILRDIIHIKSTQLITGKITDTYIPIEISYFFLYEANALEITSRNASYVVISSLLI